MPDDHTPTQNTDTSNGAGRRDALILLVVLVALVVWGVSIALWGVPGLYIPALCMVPIVWVLLVMISRG